MKIMFQREASTAELPKSATAITHIFCVEIGDISSHATDLITIINDTSWISKLCPVAKMSYERTAIETAKILVSIFQKARGGIIESDFGEYLISITSSQCLVQKLAHEAVPISELWKEKITGNHGFDFHTETPSQIISFGEAKYNSNQNSYTDAAKQVIEFIKDEKDKRDAVHLQNFVTSTAIDNLENGRRCFAVAFSIISKNYEKIMGNALSSGFVQQLSTQCDELYLIGVKV